jgi:argininosuccinate lyase
MDACRTLDGAIRDLQQVMLTQAGQLREAILPAYTHLQRAQPVYAAHWMLSHFWPLERDRVRLAAAAHGASSLPLGSGAVAGSAFPVSRELLRERLGFATVSANSVDAVADRDFVAETLFALTLLGTHLSRLAEDLILFGSGEFGFARFGDAFSTGSSMMPQKRNPDVFEIARGSAARMLGDLTTVLVTLKGLPSGYNKDLQDDKRPLFDAVDTMMLVLPAVAGALEEIRFDAVRMRAAVSASLMATDLADYLVDRGVSFREAHGAVGRLVREAEQAGLELDALPLQSFAAAHVTFGADVLDALKPERSLARRNLPGGTGPEALQNQLRAAAEALTR